MQRILRAALLAGLIPLVIYEYIIIVAMLVNYLRYG